MNGGGIGGDVQVMSACARVSRSVSRYMLAAVTLYSMTLVSDCSPVFRYFIWWKAEIKDIQAAE